MKFYRFYVYILDSDLVWWIQFILIEQIFFLLQINLLNVGHFDPRYKNKIKTVLIRLIM